MWTFVRATVAAAAVVGMSASARAHNPDTSYARFEIARDRFAATLTYDVTSLVRIFPGLDADGNAQLNEAELQAAAPKIVEFLRKSLRVEIDDKPADLGAVQPIKWPRAAGESIPEKEYHAATALVAFAFVKPLDRPPTGVWLQFEFFDTLDVRHTVLASYEHEGKKDEVLFSLVEPDYAFYTKYPSSEPPAASGSATATATATGTTTGETVSSRRSESGSGRSSNDTLFDRLVEFFLHGVEHIFTGYDHILFLLSLIVVSKFREVVKIVTAFTVAHSLTLALATAGWAKIPSKDGWVPIPSQLVESAIALTIVYTALENFWIKNSAKRWRIAFLFGLIHGFGFAGILANLPLPPENFFRSLLAFNLGVEAGQLAIVAAMFVPCALVNRWKRGRAVKLGISAIIALFGLAWFINRAFSLEMMPF